MSEQDIFIYAAIRIVALITYSLRVCGLALMKNVRQDSFLFPYTNYITYALISALVIKLIVTLNNQLAKCRSAGDWASVSPVRRPISSIKSISSSICSAPWPRCPSCKADCSRKWFRPSFSSLARYQNGLAYRFDWSNKKSALKPTYTRHNNGDNF